MDTSCHHPLVLPLLLSEGFFLSVIKTLECIVKGNNKQKGSVLPSFDNLMYTERYLLILYNTILLFVDPEEEAF